MKNLISVILCLAILSTITVTAYASDVAVPYSNNVYGAVPKFKGLFSRGFTGIRTAIWRVTGSWISNSTTSLIGANITNFVRLFRSSSWNKAWDIASCFFSAGSMIAGLLDYLDGRFDGKCKVW